MNKFKTNTKPKSAEDMDSYYPFLRNKSPQVQPSSLYIPIDIRGPVVDSEYYAEDFERIANAVEGDTIHVRIHTYGGATMTALEFFNALRQTPAHVITENVSVAMSAGSIILFAGDEVRVQPNSITMVHAARYGAYGQQENVKQQVDFEDKWLKDTFAYFYEGLFTEEEMKDIVINCKQHYMTSDEVIERLHKRNDYLLEKQAKEEDEATEKELKDLEDNLDALGYALPTDSELEAMSKEQLISYIKGEEIVFADEENSDEVPLAFTMSFADDHYQAFVYEDGQVVIESSDDELSVNLICAERDLLVLLADDLDIEVKSKDPTERILKKIQKEIKAMLK